MKRNYFSYKNILYLLIGLFIVTVASIVTTQTAAAHAHRQPIKLIIDTDTGVDDATAIAWLLDQERYPVQILGMATVVGNTSTENAANNVLNLLAVAGRTDVPVVIGAAAPLEQTVSRTGSMIHGPDGLWFVGMQNPKDISGLSRNVADFYCQKAAPDVTIIALGPLTNLAMAAEACPDTLRSVRRIVFLGGSKEGGNRTPNAEFNVWADPEAANQVMTAHLPMTLVTLDAFKSFQLSQEDITNLQQHGTPLGQFIATPLQMYIQAQAGSGGNGSVPDVVAVTYTLDSTLGEAQSGLVKVSHGIFEDDVNHELRGKTTIGFTFTEKMSMLATDAELSGIADRAFSDPNFNLEAEMGAILAREPDNAQVILKVRYQKIRKLFMRELEN